MRDSGFGGGHKRQTLLALSFILLIFLGVLSASVEQSLRAQLPEGSSAVADRKAVLCSLEDSFSEIAERVEAGVVSITAVQRIETTGGFRGNDQWSGLEEFFRWFFEEDQQQPTEGIEGPQFPPGSAEVPPVTAAGSGTIVRRRGNEFYVLTNYHLVQNAYRVDVRLADQSDIRGTVIGADPVTDLAVVRIASPKLSDRNVVPLGDSATVRVGSWALAVGSPFGFEHSLTVGVVSALQRELREEETFYPDLIQTDAAINKGNSGGPLLNMEGHVIGINAAIASPTGGFVGLGFAIPINTAKAVLEELIQEGRVVRGWLGVGIQELTPVLREFYGVPEGVLVASVAKAGPVAKAGLAGEDVIVSIGGAPVSEVRQLQRLVAGFKPGTSVPMVVVRNRRKLSLVVQIGLSPSTLPGRPSPPSVKEDVGVRVRTLTPELARQIGVKETKGVIVIDVMPGSPAEGAGLERGDVVVSFNGRAVTSEGDFGDMLRDVRPAGIVVLKVIRKGAPRMIGFRTE